jgi:hypothetical protein
MSSLSAKDRASLCSFTFADGRRCRSPRARNNSRFCSYHAEKEARARTTQKLGKDLDYFFSGDYLSACDLSTALARLIPAVVRGDVKPRAARTVAYLMQTLLQSIHISAHEYCEAFSSNAWRQAVRNSVNGNRDYCFPPAPAQPASSQPQPAAVAAVAHPFRGEASGPASPPQPAPPPQPAQTPEHCQSSPVAQAFGPEKPASSSNSPIATDHSFTPSEAEGPLPQKSPRAPLPATAAEFADTLLSRLPRSAFTPALSSGSDPGNTGGGHSGAVAQASRPEESASSSNSPLTTRLPVVTGHSPLPQALHFDHNCRLLIDGKPF